MSLSVKRVFAQRWADMSDDDSLGEQPGAGTANIKAQLAASIGPVSCLTPDAQLTTEQHPSTAGAAAPSAHQQPMPPPAPPATDNATTAPASLSASAKPAASTPSPSIVFQSKPKPGFKSWTDLARPSPVTAASAPFVLAAADPVRRVLSFDGDDDNSRMDSMPPPLPRVVAAAAPVLYDPELDNSRDGLPLLMRQSTMVTAMGRLAEDESDGMDASMETSRDRGVKRKQAEAEAPTPTNTPVKWAAAQSKQLVTAWAAAGQAAALFGKTRSATAAIQVKDTTAATTPAALAAVKGEAVTKKQKVSESQAVPTKAATPRGAAACPAPLPVSIIQPVSVGGRVTRSAWKRFSDVAAPVPPPSPALSAINSVSPAARKQRMVVKKKDLTPSTPAPAAAPLTIDASTPADSSPASAATPSTPASPTPSAASASPAPPPSPRTLARRLEQRLKQVQLGKRTVGYARYRAAVAKRERVEGQHPRTPNAKRACSKRSWDGQVRKWRRELHRWDEGKNGEREEGGAEAEEEEDGSEEGGEVEEGEVVSELGSEWSMRDEGEAASELGSELDSQLSSRRVDEPETTEMPQAQEVAAVA